MHINAPILSQQIPHENKALINHGDEAVRAFAPGVAVGKLFKHIGFFGEGVVADLNVHGEISAHVERRVNVNKLDAALLFNLFADGAVFKA